MKLAVFEKILSLAEKAVWGLPTLLLLVGVGVYLTVRTRFFQFRTFLPMLKHTLGEIFAPKKDRELAARGTVTPFQSLCTALSATIGTGNIAGVAYAMVMGGAGAVSHRAHALFPVPHISSDAKAHARRNFCTEKG